MDLHSEMIMGQYKDNLENYAKLRDIVVGKLNELKIDNKFNVNNIASRIKTEESLLGKLVRKGDKYKSIFDITDIVGAMVVTFYIDDVDKISSFIESNFEVDWDNCIDKRKIYEINQFGYMSLHFVCRLPKSIYYDENNTIINEIPFEIQLKTLLQYTWASIEHDIGYKSDVEIPKDYLRDINRLSGLLELADAEFKRIRTVVSEYREKVKSFVASGNFNDIDLNMDSFNAFIEFGAFKKLNENISNINNIEIIETSLERFLPILKSMGFNTLADLDKLIKDYSDMAYRFALVQFGGKDIDIITSSVGLTCLCVVYILSKGLGEGVLKLFYTQLNGEKKSNDILLKKSLEISKKIGIIK